MVSYPGSITGPVTVTGDLAVAANDVNGGLRLTNAATVTSNGDLYLTENAAGARTVAIDVIGDTFNRYLITADGATAIGPGNGARDVTVGRTGAGVWGVSQGSLAVTTAGQGLQIKEGANAKAGTAVLNGATEVTVATTAVTATSRIQLTVQAPGGTPAGVAYVSSRIAGTSFGIKGVALDTSTVAWLIVEPA